MRAPAISIGGYPTPSNTSTGNSSTGYDAAPLPRSGTNPYGYIPGNIGLPDPAADLARVYPNLGPTNAAVSGNIMAELQGQLSPGTIRQLQDAAATFGVQSGMPGSQFQGYSGLRNLGLASEQLSQRGLADYNAATQGISQTQTVNPALQAQIAETNAINAAAPDPTLAAQEEQRKFDEYLSMLMGAGGGGPAGGTVNRSGWNNPSDQFDTIHTTGRFGQGFLAPRGYTFGSQVV